MGINRERNLWLPASSAQEMEDSANFGRLNESCFNDQNSLNPPSPERSKPEAKDCARG